VIHLYALARGTRLPAGEVGVDGAELEIVSCGEIDAVVSEHDHAPAADRAGALRHAAVVAAVAGHAEVVPVRYGVQHQDRASLRAAVRDAAPALLRSLERVGGHVEFVIRRDPAAFPSPAPRAPAPPPSEERPGRRYLEDRLAEERRARDAERVATAELRALTGPLDGQAAVVVERSGPHGPERCYLVERQELGTFTAAASACLKDREELVLGGPWPPYTFATEELGT
jgi:hypothetical protein